MPCCNSNKKRLPVSSAASKMETLLYFILFYLRQIDTAELALLMGDTVISVNEASGKLKMKRKSGGGSFIWMFVQMHPLLGERQSASCVNYLCDVLSG